MPAAVGQAVDSASCPSKGSVVQLHDFMPTILQHFNQNNFPMGIGDDDIRDAHSSWSLRDSLNDDAHARTMVDEGSTRSLFLILRRRVGCRASQQ